MSAAVEECFTRTAAGALEPWTEGSARPVAEVRRHAGFVPDAEMEPRAMNGLEARADRARQIDRRQISALPRYDGYASAVGGRPDTGRRILKGCM